jgi:hypothetical protein
MGICATSSSVGRELNRNSPISARLLDWLHSYVYSSTCTSVCRPSFMNDIGSVRQGHGDLPTTPNHLVHPRPRNQSHSTHRHTLMSTTTDFLSCVLVSLHIKVDARLLCKRFQRRALSDKKSVSMQCFLDTSHRVGFATFCYLCQKRVPSEFAADRTVNSSTCYAIR